MNSDLEKPYSPEAMLSSVGSTQPSPVSMAIEGDDLFYRGEIARTIVDQCRGGGGCLTRADLESYRVELREPLAVEYGGV